MPKEKTKADLQKEIRDLKKEVKDWKKSRDYIVGVVSERDQQIQSLLRENHELRADLNRADDRVNKLIDANFNWSCD